MKRNAMSKYPNNHFTLLQYTSFCGTVQAKCGDLLFQAYDVLLFIVCQQGSWAVHGASYNVHMTSSANADVLHRMMYTSYATCKHTCTRNKNIDMEFSKA